MLWATRMLGSGTWSFSDTWKRLQSVTLNDDLHLSSTSVYYLPGLQQIPLRSVTWLGTPLLSGERDKGTHVSPSVDDRASQGPSRPNLLWDWRRGGRVGRQEQNLSAARPRSSATASATTQLLGPATAIRGRQTIAKPALCPQRLPANDRLDESDCSIKTLISNLD